MDRKKRRKMAAAAAVDGGVRFDGMSSKQLVGLWEDVIDRDVVAARKVFFRALLRDAAAEYKQAAAARGAAGEEEGQDRGYQHERFLLRPCSWEASPQPQPPPEPMVVLCLRAAPPPPPPTPHLAVGGMEREALSRDATAEHKQEEVARRAATAGVEDGGGEDRGHPPHERLSSTPCREASPPSEPTRNNAPTVVLCLPARSRRRAAAGLELEEEEDEDQGCPAHERLILAPCSTPREEASPPEPTPIAPMVVLCLRTASPAPVQTSRRRGASDHAR